MMRRETAPRPLRRWIGGALAILAAIAAACTTVPDEPPGAARKEMVFAVTDSHALVSFNAGQPGRLLSRHAIKGLAAGEAIVGIDFRVARGQLYALTDRGRLLRIDTASGATIRGRLLGIDTASGATTSVGQPLSLALDADVAFDFNPTVDRIRVVTGGTGNLRLHPDTGAQVDGDPATPGIQADGVLAYVAGDPGAGQTPRIVAAAYTYNKRDEKLTTNYAIDAARGTLVMQGSPEGATPVVSPNTGRLTTVGPLGIAAIGRASFDIADISNAAFTAVTAPGARASDWYEIDLGSGRATRLGRIGAGEPVRGVAVEP